MSEDLQTASYAIDTYAGQKNPAQDKKATGDNDQMQEPAMDVSPDTTPGDMMNITHICVEEVAIDGICGVY